MQISFEKSEGMKGPDTYINVGTDGRRQRRKLFHPSVTAVQTVIEPSRGRGMRLMRQATEISLRILKTK